ncbi:alginate lyase family protein [Bacillus toyonensis]
MSSFLQKIYKLKGKPVHIIARKVAQKSYDAIYYKGRKIIVSRNLIDLEEEVFKDFQPLCNFLFKTKEKLDYVNKLKKLDVEAETIRDADEIYNHVFNLLGSGDVQLGKKIPWNKDFKTGFVWENQFYKDIKIVDLSNNADVKIPWELSRFQHIPTIGKAYWITKDEKYAREFKEQLLDWIEKNPIEMSVNWACTMDVAIRAVNWIIGYYFFKDSIVINEEFWMKFHKNLYLHGKFIYKNLENKGDYTGNHYLSNIIGLIWIGIYFGDFKVSGIWNENNPKRWLEYGFKELEKEMYVQVNEDGTNYEASTSYHRLVTELFLMTTILCTKNNINFSTGYLKRLEKMCEFIMHLTQPNGRSPLIGDADDGRLIIFSKYGSWIKNDFRHLLAISGEYFNREDFRYYGSSYKEEALWLIGEWNNNEVMPILSSNYFENGGYYILRNERTYCSIRCGENSFRGEGVHSHNDQLSFTLNIDGEDIFIDPGAFIYTGDYKMRNLFRSTAMHNTLEIPNYEQNDFDVKNLFYMKEQTFSECIETHTNKFVGQHQGYLKKCGVIHKRSFLLERNNMYIKDELLGKRNQLSYKINLILDPVSSLRYAENEIYISKNNLNININFNEDVAIKIEDIYVSSSYGIKRKSKKIIVEHCGNFLETSITFAN